MARRSSKWMLMVLALAGGLAVRAVACGGADRPKLEPDERLALHAKHLCAIAKAGAAEPRAGVVRMLRYHGDHAPDMAAALAETLVLIERIPDDRAHDARARVARERLRAPVVACEEPWQRFVDAVGKDPEAAAILERATTRLGRTIEIVFGHGQALGLDPRGWLPQLDAARR